MARFKRVLPVVVFASLAAMACETAKSANPLSASVAGPIPGVSITAPTPLDPPQGAQVVSDGTPMTLTAQNATTSGDRTLYLQVQLASDTNFQQVLHHNERIQPGENGRTAYRLPEPLGAGHTYYWRVRAVDGANTGPYSYTSTFSVINKAVIDPPVPVEPAGKLANTRPTFRIRNGRIEHTEAFYRFEIANAPNINALVAVITVAPGSNGETTMTLGDLPYGTTFYWRAYGTDGLTMSEYSSVISFTTPNAPAAPPPPTPGPINPGQGGGARTPNPAPGQRLPEPNGFPIVQAVANQYPQALLNSCQEHGGSWQFMDILVDTLRLSDTRYGYGWKRGVVGDPLMDVVTYNWSSDPDEGTHNIYTFDAIGGHCGSNPVPVWNNTQPGGGPGATSWTGRGRF